jgi:phosphatidylserine synthase
LLTTFVVVIVHNDRSAQPNEEEPMSSIDLGERTRPRVSPPWSTDAVGIGAAVVCALVTWFCAARLADVDLTVRQGDETMTVGGLAVAVVAAGCALLGFATLRLLERATDRALPVWTVVAVVVALLSLLGPQAATTADARSALMSLHGVVAAVVIAAALTSRRRRAAR